MKLCKDCKYFVEPDEYCVKHARNEVSPVTGKKKAAGFDKAWRERLAVHWFAVLGGTCGVRGRFWEPK